MGGMLPEKPERQKRRLLGQGEVEEWSVRLRTVTPILGGGAAPRTLDEVDPIRAPSIRGQLRFWWRALYGQEATTAAEFAKEEGRLWGCAGSDKARRSPVEIQVIEPRIQPRSPIPDQTHRIHKDTAAARREQIRLYALWPATIDRAPYREEGVQFQLVIRAPRDQAPSVKSAIAAWILFGGCGSRVRRGCGSLMVDGSDRKVWLPVTCELREIQRVVGGLPILSAADADRSAADMPSLCGADLWCAGVVRDAEQAWLQALGWLMDFRQGMPECPNAPVRGFARAFPKGDMPRRAGRSNWPEADKIRRLVRLPSGYDRWEHPPRHNATAVWPRAAFGLPIIGQFQRQSRNRGPDRKLIPYKHPEPGDFELRWIDARGAEHGRLASPLVVKALPLANGHYVPIALWLCRSYPKDGRIMLFYRPPDAGAYRVPGSEAEFDALRAPNDLVLYHPLEGKTTLHEAFLEWLNTTGRAQRAPQ